MAITIYMNDTTFREDGAIYTYLQTTWAGARDATTGTVTDTGGANSTGIRDGRFPGRGAGYFYSVSRSFLQFDTSTILTRPNSCQIGIYGYLNGVGRVNCVKATAVPFLNATDFDAIEGWVAGVDNSGNVTPYAVEIGSWSTSGYNYFQANDTALDDMTANSTLEVCLLGRGDLRNISPSSDLKNGLYFSESGTITGPKLVYVPSTDAVFFGANF
jgi:hypothetical protein